MQWIVKSHQLEGWVVNPWVSHYYWTSRAWLEWYHPYTELDIPTELSFRSESAASVTLLDTDDVLELDSTANSISLDVSSVTQQKEYRIKKKLLWQEITISWKNIDGESQLYMTWIWAEEVSLVYDSTNDEFVTTSTSRINKPFVTAWPKDADVILPTNGNWSVHTKLNEIMQFFDTQWGWTLFIKSWDYEFQDATDVPSGVAIIWESPTSVKFNKTTEWVYAMFRNSDPVAWNSGIRIESVSIDGAQWVYANGILSWWHGIKFIDVTDCLVENVIVENVEKTWVILIEPQAWSTSWRTHNERVKFVNCTVKNARVWVLMVKSVRSSIINCVAEDIFDDADGPWFGLEFKNDCQFCSIVWGITRNCAWWWVVFWHDTNEPKTGINCTVDNVIIEWWVTGFFLNDCDYVSCSNIQVSNTTSHWMILRWVTSSSISWMVNNCWWNLVDMWYSDDNWVHWQTAATDSSVTITAMSWTPLYWVRMRPGTERCHVWIKSWDLGSMDKWWRLIEEDDKDNFVHPPIEMYAQGRIFTEVNSELTIKDNIAMALSFENQSIQDLWPNKLRITNANMPYSLTNNLHHFKRFDSTEEHIVEFEDHADLQFWAADSFTIVYTCFDTWSGIMLSKMWSWGANPYWYIENGATKMRVQVSDGTSIAAVNLDNRELERNILIVSVDRTTEEIRAYRNWVLSNSVSIAWMWSFDAPSEVVRLGNRNPAFPNRLDMTIGEVMIFRWVAFTETEAEVIQNHEAYVKIAEDFASTAFLTQRVDRFDGLTSWTTVNLVSVPDSSQSVLVYRNGDLMWEWSGDDYTISWSTITFTTSFGGTWSERVQVIYYA